MEFKTIYQFAASVLLIIFSAQLRAVGEPTAANPITTATIGSNGGVIESSIGSVWFPGGSFNQDTKVSLFTTQEKIIDEWFKDTTVIYKISSRAQREVRIGLGNSVPLVDMVDLELKVPDDMLKNLALGEKIDIFAGIEQGGENQPPFTVFELIESVYNASTKTLQFQLPGAAFAKNELTQGEYQALIVLGVVQDQVHPNQSSSRVIHAVSACTC